MLIGLIIGIYSYALLALGLTGLLHRASLIWVTVLFAACFAIAIKYYLRGTRFSNIVFTFHEKALLILLLVLVAVNLIGALGPELAFDALWYHLTIPKLFVMYHKVYFIEDPLFYYSLMPKLTEMLYMVPISFGSEIGAKLIHFSFGILSLFAVFKLSRIYFSRFLSLVAVTIFYASPVVGWLSITAYSDLSRSFYECMALYYFLVFTKDGKNKSFLLSAIFLGFAICVKVLSIGTISIFILLLFFLKTSIYEKIFRSLVYVLVSILIPLPWFLISYFYTSNPFYPLFTHLTLRNSLGELLSPFYFIKTFVNNFLFSPDPVHPFIFLMIPFILISFKSLLKKYSLVTIYSVASYILWYATSQTGGARFLTSFMPAYILLGLIALKTIKKEGIQKIILFTSLILCCITPIYRGVANIIYVPFILGFESKQEFLMRELNFSFGDFYDQDNAIKKIVSNNSVLLVNMHNLYYVDFNYVLSVNDSRWGKKYILVQNSALPEGFGKAQVVYSNKNTKVKLYRL